MADRIDRAGVRSALREFLDSEAAGGVLLMAAAALALIAANGPFAEAYHHILHDSIGPELSRGHGPLTAHLVINDGLMAIFFLFVGLEIKRELVDGRLSSWDRRRLPFIAAAVGMGLPALFYLTATKGDGNLSAGWAIPAATDIPFAIGVLALLGSRAPASLKLFLTTVAIVDDMGAVAIIALAYTPSLHTLYLGIAAGILFVMYAMGKSGVSSLWVYLLGGAILWYAVLLSGVHATIAGVLTATAVPLVKTPGAPDSNVSPLHRLEHALAPIVGFLVVPVFGFANAGVSLEGMGFDEIFAPLPLGIAAGLFFGKQIGIFGAVYLCAKLGIASRLRGASWMQVYGVSALCGIGFTMSLFIGALAFPTSPLLVEEAKIGVLMGSFLSALVGFAILWFAPRPEGQAAADGAMDGEIDIDGDVLSTEDSAR